MKNARISKILISVVLLCAISSVKSQEILTLEQCHKEVQVNYPLIKAKEILRNSSKLNIQNIKLAYFPKLYANGKISYQSDVTGLNLPGLDTPKAPKDQFSMNLDVEQLIYNGGRTKSRLKLEKLATEVEVQDVEVQMFALRERVNDAFFSILLLRKSYLVLRDKKETVLARLNQVKSAVSSGMLAVANQKVFEAEVLMIDQQMEEIKASEKAALTVLAELMGRDVSFDVEYKLETHEDVLNSLSLERKRPEYQLYLNQKSLLDEQINFSRKNRMPLITAFGQLGFGKPGYNQLLNDTDSYYMVGAKISWNIFDWKENKRKQRIYDFQKDLVDVSEAGFYKNQSIELTNEQNNVAKFKKLLERDNTIVILKEDITKNVASQLENGIITSSEYIEELNKEIQAKLNREYHQIQLYQSIEEMKRIAGDTN